MEQNSEISPRIEPIKSQILILYFKKADYSAANAWKHNAIVFWDEDYNIFNPMMNESNN